MTESQFTKTSKGAADTDYYALLGLEERYALDEPTLERHYLERSKRVHPDRFVNAPASERVAALQQSMTLNQAYKTLKKPLARAEYLLARHGVPVVDGERLDPGFLMEILELREELADAKANGDRPTLERLEETMLDRRDEALGQVKALFSAYFKHAAASEASGEARRDDVLQTIKRQVIVLRYINRYLDQFDDIDIDLEDGP